MLDGSPPTPPCATAWQAMSCLALLAALAAALVLISRRRIRRSGVPRAEVSAIVAADLVWQFLAFGFLAGTLAGFLAPCSATRWY